ncbi:MAG: SDR family NAD(P)-dependent oxidoreductase [Ignavibacteria bacterium]|jgi:NAD(P)-dependent dehydrogenase (short-subunit alcohol dehydrogenase family)
MQITRFERGLHDRVAIVTGAAVGNGRAFCERLAEEGAKLVIADLELASETERLVKEAGGAVVTVQADMTNPVDVARVVDTAIASFGRVDILVHNVGYYFEEPFELVSYEEWKRTLDVTLDSLFHTVRAVLPHMKKAEFGRIITFSSDTVWLGTPYLVHYVTAKMGVIGFTRSLAAEVGKYGITINSISVGLTATQSAGTNANMSSMLEHIIPTQAVHRADEPEDIANVVAFLALPASGIITGQTINVDGGVARH